MGKILAYAGLMDNLEVTWMPAYGPEQRGGTANVTVILSDQPISSPVLNTYDTAVILNQQSLDKFESKVKTGGTLIYDPYSIHHAPTRTDINIYPVEAMEATFELSSSKAYNMVLLGSLLKVRGLLPVEAVMKGLKKTPHQQAGHTQGHGTCLRVERFVFALSLCLTAQLLQTEKTL